MNTAVGSGIKVTPRGGGGDGVTSPRDSPGHWQRPLLGSRPIRGRPGTGKDSSRAGMWQSTLNRWHSLMRPSSNSVTKLPTRFCTTVSPPDHIPRPLCSPSEDLIITDLTTNPKSPGCHQSMLPAPIAHRTQAVLCAQCYAGCGLYWG